MGDQDREDRARIERAIHDIAYENMLPDKELEDLDDGALLANLKWARKETDALILKRNLTNDANLQEDIIEFFTYINKIHQIFEKRGKKFDY
ncbi:MAG: hypothetical protein HYZ51_00125 [Candidatus Doudnabacteria bacterium]|nr:hypothetical protein [Candidatus Doudnabacteria bacterium]